jgi:cytoskeleton protein RodZ
VSQVEHSEGQEQALPSPGERLRLAREERGLRREEVAAQLHLSVAKIEALERGEVANIVAPVFLAGYLRAYARMVDLPADEIVGAFETLSELTPPSIDPTRAPAASSYGRLGAGLPKGFSLARRGTWFGLLRWGLVGVVLVAIAGVLWQMRSHNQEAAVAEVAKTIAVPPVSESATDEGTGAAEAVTEVATVSTPPKVPLAPRARLFLSLSADCWVEIRDAQGNRLMHQLAKAGEEHDLTGVAPFEVMLGYAPGVRMEYNGEPYDLSRYQGRRTVRFTVGASGDRMN